VIVANLKGGLGNQMFQYAAGRAMSLRYNTGLVLVKDDLALANTKRHYQLDAFNIVSEDEVMGAVAKDMVYLNGYFQSEKYFADYARQIRQDFTLKTNGKETIDPTTMSVGIHVRRGDYVTDPVHNQFHGLCPAEYYRKSIEFVKGKIGPCHFYLFSDDPQWAKDNLPGELVSGNGRTDQEELLAMASCRHQIIANSSFSWWAAYLNPRLNKIVVAPQKWFASGSPKDLISSEWVTQ
jgi:hypothetical protein